MRTTEGLLPLARSGRISITEVLSIKVPLQIALPFASTYPARRKDLIKPGADNFCPRWISRGAA